MMITRRAVLAAILSAVAVQATAQDLGVTGRYVVQGVNPDGSRYQGTAQMIQIGTRVRMSWDVAGQTYSGEGVVTGTTLTVDWGSDAPVIYDISNPETLVGTWARGAAGEVLTRVP